jgi:energy-coupling factor transporter ATP-binding protein EcfA2
VISLIIGNKGSGKTKHLIELINEAVEKSDGNVVCIEKQPNLRYNVTYRARLIDTDRFKVSNHEAFYGFLSGIIASDHDITEIFIDATLKIVGKDNFEAFADFLKRVDELSRESDVHFVMTVSAGLEDIPERVFEFAEKI